jgi:predicted dehydrogenase
MAGYVIIERILIVGLGSIGKRHLRLARELLPAADIRVLRHQACEETPEFANGCFSSIDQAIEFAPQIAVIAGPAPFHLGVALSLAQVGTHLLIEKPLSASLDGIPALLAVCRERGLVLLIGYNLRFLPSLQRFRSLVQENLIGRVTSVRCEIGQHLSSWRPDADYRQSVSARRELGGGALLELSHELDYLRWIFGEIDWVTASLSQQSDLEIDVEDTAHLILGFVPAGDSRRLIAAVNMDFVRHDTTRICLAIGENGSLRWNGLTGVVDHLQAGSTQWREVFHHQHQRDESYLTQWRHFMACVDGQQRPLIGGEDGFMVMKMVEAARQASDAGRQIRIMQGPTGQEGQP